MSHSTLSPKQQYWLDHVRAADLRDSTLAAYATEHGISTKSLYGWKTKLIRQKRYSADQVSHL